MTQTECKNPHKQRCKTCKYFEYGYIHKNVEFNYWCHLKNTFLSRGVVFWLIRVGCASYEEKGRLFDHG